jgi:hypothetical protein
MSISLQRIATIAEQFKGLPYDFAFLGGAVLEVLITDIRKKMFINRLNQICN